METRANYVLIGAFTLAVVVGIFGFVYWFQNIGGTGERLFYRVQFEGSVSTKKSTVPDPGVPSAGATGEMVAVRVTV